MFLLKKGVGLLAVKTKSIKTEFVVVNPNFSWLKEIVKNAKKELSTMKKLKNAKSSALKTQFLMVSVVYA